MLLRIASRGVAAVESFTVLGASSSRGNSDKIGQFGSGAKHAILCALRERLDVTIYCGNTKIVPFTQPQTIHGTDQQRVLFKIGTRTETSSMTLDFGSLDWREPIKMMLREFISNALDAANGVWDDIVIEKVEKPRAKSDWTQVFIPLTASVEDYINELSQHFLQATNKQEKVLLPQEPGNCRFYRKGVFVHEVKGAKSLYSYNCGDELPIDESRNLDTYRVRNYAAELLCKDKTALRNVMRKIVNGDSEFYEATFSQYYLDGNKVKEAFIEEFGANTYVESNAMLAERAKARGVNVVVFPECGFYSVLSSYVGKASSQLNLADQKNLTTFPASQELRKNVQAVWDVLKLLDHTHGKEFPPILEEFNRNTECNEMICGFYDKSNNGVYIHRDHLSNWSTILEELLHYITGAHDETRDFQNIAFAVASAAMKELHTIVS